MALRTFEYAEAKATMGDIQRKADEVKKHLAKCQSIIDENVGVKNRWSGERATKFKERWNRTSENFNSFVETINQYASKIDESYKKHQQYEES